MRRVLLGSILFSWIAFLAAVTVVGIASSGTGLLQEMQQALMVLPVIPLEFVTARAVLTGTIVGTLTITLWAVMIALTTAEEEHRERVMSLGTGFSWVLAATAVLMVVALVTGAGSALAMLFAIQLATFLSMLAAGGVEFAWEVRSLASTPDPQAEEEAIAERVSRHMAQASAKLAALTGDRSGEPG